MESYKDKYTFKVTWEPFLLRPNMPPEGAPKGDNYGPNSPSAQRLINVGRSVGVEFAYKAKRFPNTIIGHCALEYALLQDPTGHKQNLLQEGLFKSYFTDGEYPDAEVVSTLASTVGLNKDDVKAYVQDESNQSQVREKAGQWSLQGVSGVPFFIVNDQKTFSGAQDPRNFLHIFDKVHEKFPLSTKA
ncbi:unnamed protein product [Clavelina lepadiformis]|uniref:DSBA-like thioredoxin domain-containing protein n=1 Tax=Clavelina lepadiformis TaxID=159417 RepID=A0ABP0GV92_CLALP